MQYLILTVVLNVYLAVTFKLFPRFGIDTFQAIVINYWVCTLTGTLYAGNSRAIYDVLQEPWMPWAAGLGLGFILIFNLISYVTQHQGIAVASVANKISLILSATLSIFLYNESVGWAKILGIALAIPAVYLSFKNSPVSTQATANGQQIMWPVLLFIGSGTLDALMQYVQYNFITTPYETKLLPLGIFFTAACIGTLWLLYKMWQGQLVLHWKNVVAGILLGVPNYASIYFFIRFLQSQFVDSSTAIAVTNILVVLTSVIVAAVFFKEPLNRQKIIGICLAILAIALMALATFHD